MAEVEKLESDAEAYHQAHVADGAASMATVSSMGAGADAQGVGLAARPSETSDETDKVAQGGLGLGGSESGSASDGAEDERTRGRRRQHERLRSLARFFVP